MPAPRRHDDQREGYQPSPGVKEAEDREKRKRPQKTGVQLAPMLLVGRCLEFRAQPFRQMFLNAFVNRRFVELMNEIHCQQDDLKNHADDHSAQHGPAPDGVVLGIGIRDRLGRTLKKRSLPRRGLHGAEVVERIGHVDSRRAQVSVPLACGFAHRFRQTPYFPLPMQYKNRSDRKNN